jgi:hypothetical protein
MRLTTIKASVAAVIAAGAATLALPAASAFADYGNTAVHQIELSANISGLHGGGVWLWIELSSNYTADYSGSDCGHGGAGAASDTGSATWTQTGGSLVITGVVLNGLGGFPTTITVPAADGHYVGTIGTYLTLPSFIPPSIGNSQLEIAP